MSDPQDSAAGGQETVVAVAWYKPSQWQRLREISVDGARELGESYEQWHAAATRRLVELKRAGRRAEKVTLDVEELSLWCQGQNRPVDAQARAEFAAGKLRQT